MSTRRTRYKSSKPSSSSNSSWKKENKNEYRSRDKFVRGILKEKGESSINESPNLNRLRRERHFKCWKCQRLDHVTKDCPNKRTMTIQDGEVVTEGEESENEERKEEIVEVGETSDGSFEEPIVRHVLVTRRALSAQLKEDLVEE
ncbi:Zinc finger, CCHC-type [Cucumis melo var. makuwa]|uniref:Zinc finger, CCHC-type n=1 Tax=Cucumis melo var. makuwa TaxID=1194695 RepID=A0A5A7TYN5_CUCMM|nr:Zinc finger, CCHC-type [Cucumis melo var. makuwa]